MSKNREIVPWLSTLVTEGLTPTICVAAREEAKATEALMAACHEPDNWQILRRLEKWEKEGLPRHVYARLVSLQGYVQRTGNSGELVHQLIWCAKRSVEMGTLGRRWFGGKRQRDGSFDNGVELRNNVPGKVCQCCGKITERGEQVVLGFRRRGTRSNRTGYIHVRCLKQFKINGEKLFKRQIHLSASQPSTPVKTIVRCRLSDHKTCSTAKGLRPTHVMWVGMGGTQESVPFNIEALNRRRNLSK